MKTKILCAVALIAGLGMGSPTNQVDQMIDLNTNKLFLFLQEDPRSAFIRFRANSAGTNLSISTVTVVYVKGFGPLDGNYTISSNGVFGTVWTNADGTATFRLNGSHMSFIAEFDCTKLKL
jgi:hypothetical protein